MSTSVSYQILLRIYCTDLLKSRRVLPPRLWIWDLRVKVHNYLCCWWTGWLPFLLTQLEHVFFSISQPSPDCLLISHKTLGSRAIHAQFRYSKYLPTDLPCQQIQYSSRWIIGLSEYGSNTKTRLFSSGRRAEFSLDIYQDRQNSY